MIVVSGVWLERRGERNKMGVTNEAEIEKNIIAQLMLSYTNP